LAWAPGLSAVPGGWRGGPAARNKAEDSHRARELLDQALATYRELHIRPYRLQVSATSSADSQA